MNREKAVDGLMNCVNVLILLMIAILYAATGTRIGDNAIRAIQTGSVYRGGQAGSVALACNVSWDAENLLPMLDTLKERDVRITFFVSGQWAKSHAATLSRMAADGHEIGTSGYAPLLDGDAEMIEADVSASAAVIGGITGQAARLYYPGLRDVQVSAEAGVAAGLTQVSGSMDLLSARGSAADVVQRASERAFDGSILLMQPTAQAAEALPELIDTLWEMGYSVRPVGQLISL